MAHVIWDLYLFFFPVMSRSCQFNLSHLGHLHARDVVRKFHELWSLHNRNILSPSSGDWQSESKMPSDWLPQADSRARQIHGSAGYSTHPSPVLHPLGCWKVVASSLTLFLHPSLPLGSHGTLPMWVLFVKEQQLSWTRTHLIWNWLPLSRPCLCSQKFWGLRL